MEIKINNHQFLLGTFYSPKPQDRVFFDSLDRNVEKAMEFNNQRTIGPENAHLKPDPAVLSHHEMTLTLNTHTPLLNS